ncbi:uncharacterized protein UMAG_01650 [Mycosarcoma maydis]|uniref:Nuclear rim protein 1 n=1 Tax=Mycosarcoma maydis TaxID=5270 RepID=A0A0D1E7V0_MYCMD|nr:uncharacterized protein UMAG_01650 [Ustilago maydis 521]KIS70475.1 hypothetical protein UMAG_01650 [Ustilago maydis 521]|eukprot:XP_011387635.1 hypothetical protein UMAG_01650 [Ustilago maydis 521]
MTSHPSSPAPSLGSPAYRKGVAFGQPGWRASRASKGRVSLINSPLQRGAAYPSASPSVRGGTPSSLPGSPLIRTAPTLSTQSVRASRLSDTPDLNGFDQSSEQSYLSTPNEEHPEPPLPDRTRRKRFVRKRPLLERIQQWPVDVYYRLTSSVFDLEEQLFADQAGNVLGAILHAASLLALLLSPDSSLGSWFMNKPAHRRAQNPAIAYEYLVSHTGDESAMVDALKRHARKSVVYQTSDRFFRFASSAMFLVIFVTSCANAYLFFTKRRAYKFYSQQKPNEPTSSSMQMKHGIRQLSMWDPSPYTANLFATFSPAHAIIYPAAALVRMDAFSWFIFAFLLLAVSTPVHLILHQYQQLVKDKGVVQAAVLTEYNEKYVYPRATPVVRDQTTQTDL